MPPRRGGPATAAPATGTRGGSLKGGGSVWSGPIEPEPGGRGTTGGEPKPGGGPKPGRAEEAGAAAGEAKGAGANCVGNSCADKICALFSSSLACLCESVK